MSEPRASSDLRCAADIQAELERLVKEAVALACQPLVLDGRTIVTFEEKMQHHARERLSQISGALAIHRELDVERSLERGVRAGVQAALRRLRRLEVEHVEVWRAALKHGADEVEKLEDPLTVKTLAGQVVR